MRKYIIITLSILISAAAPHAVLREYHLHKINAIFNSPVASNCGYEAAIKLDPQSDIPLFPKLKDKQLFDAIEDLSICARPEVRKFLFAYLNSGKPYVERSISRSEIFLPIVKEIFSKNTDIPEELMYLPLLESGFDPNAVSRTNATGLWQFIAGTAKYFNLQNNEWLDERRSVEKSTESAIRHLRNLYKIHGNWELALAAYNGGSGRVNDAIKRTGSTDFWTLVDQSAFTPEMNEYVSRYAALMLIYKHQDLFGIKKQNLDKEFTSLIRISSPINLKQLADTAGVSFDAIRMYNSELKGESTPTSDKPYFIRIPKRYAQRIENAKSKVYISAYNESVSQL